MDPLVLMKNLDHVRMTSRRLSYILQQQVHLYTPEANQLREQIDRYVEAERQIEGRDVEAPHPRLTRHEPPGTRNRTTPAVVDGGRGLSISTERDRRVGQAPDVARTSRIGTSKERSSPDELRGLRQCRDACRGGHSGVGARVARLGSSPASSAGVSVGRVGRVGEDDGHRSAKGSFLGDDPAGQVGQRRACRRG